MTGRRNFSVLLIVSCLLNIYPAGGKLFVPPQPDKRAAAIQWFNEGKFNEALPLFSKLCYDEPFDFTIKYYYGACLVETGNFGLETEKNLVLASSSEVPVKVNYYLGRLYHGRGDWNNAQRFYNRFRNNAEASVIAALKVDELIKLCYTEVNPFVTEKPDSPDNAKIKEAELKKDTTKTALHLPTADSVRVSASPDQESESDVVVSSVKDSVTNDSLKVPLTVQAESVQPEEGKVHPVNEGIKTEKMQKKPDPVKYIDFQINDKVTYLVEDMFHEAEAKNEFRMAVNKETQLDSLLKVVQQLRNQYHLMANPSFRDSLAIRIQNLEYRNLVLNTEVDQHYFKSRKMEQEWWNKAGYSSFEEFSNRKDSLIRLRNIQILPEIPQVKVNIPDSAAVKVLVDSTAVKTELKADTGIVYKIQIGAYNKGIPTQRKLQFQRLEKIRTIESYSLADGKTVYTTGNLKNYNDALKLQAQIRLEGIKDAFVIGIRNGKKVTLPIEKSLK